MGILIQFNLNKVETKIKIGQKPIYTALSLIQINHEPRIAQHQFITIVEHRDRIKVEMHCVVAS